VPGVLTPHVVTGDPANARRRRGPEPAADGPATHGEGAQQRADDAHGHLAAIMAVSRAVAEGHALEDTLATIAEAGATVAGAHAAAIILRRHESAIGLAVAGSYGLSPAYAEELNHLRPIEIGSGPSGLAAARRRPVVISDVLADKIFAPWRNLAVREHYRALVSVPLQLGSNRRVIGVLNTYRRTPGPWSAEQVDVLLSLGHHAAIAVQTAGLLDESRRQVRGLSLVVRSLRTQSHEHANLVHAIYGLLEIGEVDDARQLIASVDDRYRASHARVSDGIEIAVIAGFLLAETAIAGNTGIELEIHPDSRLATLPPTVTELDAVTILGNLVHNAAEAVAEQPCDRRRVRVLVSDADGDLVIEVRDWGLGIPAHVAPNLFTAGYSTKCEHVGIGLALVRSIVHRAGGTITVKPAENPGAAFVVRIPA
jgi:signal transduction histidine kinase